MRKQKKSKKEIYPPKVVLIVALICMIISGSMGILCIRAVIPKTWPLCPGIVLESEVFKTHLTQPQKTTYTPHIVYQFNVSGETYISNQVYRTSTNASSGNYSSIRSIVDQFKIGDQVDVYYNPDNPADCVLIPTPSKIIVILLISFGALTLGLVLIAFLVHKWLKKNDPFHNIS